MSYKEYFTTLVQNIGAKEGAISPSITNSASFGYQNSKTAEAIFSGEAKKPLYARVGNPTSAKLESMMASLEGGIGAIATSSGMGAISLACMSLLEAGDEVICIGGLFGGTFSFFDETLSRFGISTKFFDVDALESVQKAITERTKIIFLESVGNPNMRLPEFEKTAQIAAQYGVALMVDNTVTPLSIRPLELGADIVIYSTTKLICGNASALGGCVVYRGLSQKNEKFATKRYAFMEKFIQKQGASALVAVGKKRALRDFGMSASAYNSQLTLLGLETLPLRLERIAKSVEAITQALDAEGMQVAHPSLADHPHHERYKRYFEVGCGPLFTLDLGTKEQAFAFLDRVKLPFITANIGDSRTLALHMDSTIYSDFDAKQKEFLGITPGLIRISVGLENPDEIIEDFLGAR